MSIVSRRTVGQILLAYDDGTSPPTETTPLGSIVSVADGTLWVSLGGGTYTQASGGGPLGDSTVWSSRIDWADLGTLPSGDIRSGDLAPISDLGGVSTSYGTAIYNGVWALFSGYFQDPADLLAFTLPKNTEAVVSVGAANEDGIKYYYDGGQWVRTPDGVPFAWNITDLTNIDPSGIGATQIGDFARYTNPTTSAVEVYRLRSVPAVGSINLTVWVPASIYDEAGLTIRGYLLGTETMPASGGTIQGYLVTTSGASASVTTSGGEVAITSTTINHFAAIQSTYALQPTDRFYVRQNLRIDQTSGGGSSRTFYQLLYSAGATQPQFITTQNPTTNSGHFVPSNTSLTFFGSTLMIRGGGSAIGNTAELVEFLADGTLLSDMVSVFRNSRPYFSMRRNAQTGLASPPTVGQHLIQTFQNATAAQTARFSHLYFMTY